MDFDRGGVFVCHRFPHLYNTCIAAPLPLLELEWSLMVIGFSWYTFVHTLFSVICLVFALLELLRMFFSRPTPLSHPPVGY